MGDRARRRRKFFGDHPICAFCAGRRLATTEDHQPGRVLFKGRVWPEGFVFPACESCNARSAQSENVVALLMHGDARSENRGAYQKLVESIRWDYPDLIKDMLPKSANEIRSIIREKGIVKPDGIAYKDFPIVKLKSDFWTPHFEMFSRKIILAFHYKIFLAPLSENGRIISWVYTNVDYMAGRMPAELIELADKLILPQRQGNYLHDQFSIRWNYIPEKSTGLYMAVFHNALVVAGISTEFPEELSLDNQRRMHPPLE